MALPEMKVTKPVSLGLRNIAHITISWGFSRGGKIVLDFSVKVSLKRSGPCSREILLAAYPSYSLKHNYAYILPHVGKI